MKENSKLEKTRAQLDAALPLLWSRSANDRRMHFQSRDKGELIYRGEWVQKRQLQMQLSKKSFNVPRNSQAGSNRQLRNNVFRLSCLRHEHSLSNVELNGRLSE